MQCSFAVLNFWGCVWGDERIENIFLLLYYVVWKILSLNMQMAHVGAAAAAVAPVENDTTQKRLKAELLSATTSKESRGEASSEKDENESTVSITVVGASGDLAKKKIFPALFALYYEDCLPKVGI